MAISKAQTTLLPIIIIFLLCLAGCGDSGYKGDGEIEAINEPVIPNPDFCHVITSENAEVSVYAFGSTEIQIDHTGGCAYRFDLYIYPASPEEAEPVLYETLAEGTGELQDEMFMHLPAADYQIVADTACEWSVYVLDGSGGCGAGSI